MEEILPSNIGGLLYEADPGCLGTQRHSHGLGNRPQDRLTFMGLFDLGAIEV